MPRRRRGRAKNADRRYGANGLTKTGLAGKSLRLHSGRCPRPELGLSQLPTERADPLQGISSRIRAAEPFVVFRLATLTRVRPAEDFDL